MIFWEGEMNCYLDGDVERTRVSIKINKKTRNLELNDNLNFFNQIQTRENQEKTSKIRQQFEEKLLWVK